MNARRAIRAVPVLLLPVLPATLAAQRPPAAIAPQRASRFLEVGHLAHLESTTSATAGFLYQITFRPSTIETLADGRRVETHPRYYAHVLATGGAGLRDGSAGFTAFGQLGIARRTDHPLFTVVAVAAQGVSDPRAIGPIGRVEIKDNIGAQAGWLFLDGGGSALFISLDYMRDILKDLGLKD